MRSCPEGPGRFDAPDGWLGALHTRTGRQFLDSEQEHLVLKQAHEAVERAGLWDELGSEWLMLDGELMPWSLKAESLIKDTYASVAASAVAATDASVAVLERAAGNGIDVQEVLSRTRTRQANARAFRESYRRYVGSADELRFAAFQVLAADELRFAAFQVLAAEGQSFEARDHGWHLDISDRLAAAGPELFTNTRFLRVDLSLDTDVEAAVRWWEELTAAGSEGMVVKPWENLTRSKRGWVQPGIKVRGSEYLRLIYGPDYLEPANLERLRQRATDRKRNRALHEYILGLHALRLTSAGAPLYGRSTRWCLAS